MKQESLFLGECQQEGIGVEGKLNAFYDVTVSVPLRETFSKEYAAALATLLNKGLKAKS